MTVTTSQASTTMRAAIYKYRGRSGGFIKVSGSDALFQGTSTGSQTYELAGNPSINANEHYMIGVLLSGGTLAVLGKQDADGGIVSPSYMDYGSAGVLPTNVPLSSLTKDATEAVPAVCYLSKESAEVM